MTILEVFLKFKFFHKLHQLKSHLYQKFYVFFLLSKILIKFFFGANFSELVGPNNTTIGISARPIICITPLSIDTAWSNLEDRAVTKAGQDNSEFDSGNKDPGTWFFIFSIICS